MLLERAQNGLDRIGTLECANWHLLQQLFLQPTLFNQVHCFSCKLRANLPADATRDRIQRRLCRIWYARRDGCASFVLQDDARQRHCGAGETERVCPADSSLLCRTTRDQTVPADEQANHETRPGGRPLLNDRHLGHPAVLRMATGRTTSGNGPSLPPLDFFR